MRLKPLVDLPKIDLIGQKRVMADHSMNFVASDVLMLIFKNQRPLFFDSHGLIHEASTKSMKTTQLVVAESN